MREQLVPGANDQTIPKADDLVRSATNRRHQAEFLRPSGPGLPEDRV